MDELERLRAENAKLRELVGLAVVDLKQNDICDYCLRQNTNEDCDCECDNCEKGCFCRECVKGTNWQWRHADKLKEIDGKDGV